MLFFSGRARKFVMTICEFCKLHGIGGWLSPKTHRMYGLRLAMHVHVVRVHVHSNTHWDCYILGPRVLVSCVDKDVTVCMLVWVEYMHYLVGLRCYGELFEILLCVGLSIWTVWHHLGIMCNLSLGVWLVINCFLVAIDALITPNFMFGFSREIVGVYVKN